MLAGQARATEQARRDLTRASLELDRFDPTSASFSFSAADALAAPKQALMMSVAGLQTASAVSFARLGSRRPGRAVDEPGRQQWLAFVAQVRRMVGTAAQVESALDGVEIGQTTVGWMGDWTTIWKSGLSPDAMHTHLQAVRVALASRFALIRIVSVVAAGAAGLAIKAAIPGGQVLLLPAVWRFVRDVLAALRRV
jgi:hypothetical protein